MSAVDDEHERHSLRELRDETERQFAELSAGLNGTAAALTRVHAAWDAGLRESMTQLDQIVAQVQQSVKLAKTLTATCSRPAL